MGKPLSPSKNILILLVGLIFTETRKYMGSSAKIVCKNCSTRLILLSVAMVKKEKGTIVVPFC
jgi:hypothetical protein